MTPAGRVERWAALARLTEGQLYSSLITLTVGGLLATGLGNVHGVVSSTLAQPALAALPSAPAAPLPAIVVSTPAPLPAPLPEPPPGDAFEAVPLAVPQAPPTSQSFPPPPTFGPPPTRSPAASPSPSPSPCTAQPLADAGAGAIWTLDGIAGGGLPDGDLIAAIALVTGCDPDDPDPSPSPSTTAGPIDGTVTR
jgi:hypothetical protein